MKITKAILKTVLAAMAVMAVFACNKDPQGGEQEPQLNEALELVVDVEDITYTSAKIKVTHNGDKSDTWYGFLTEVVAGDEEDLINMAVEAYMSGESDEQVEKLCDSAQGAHSGNLVQIHRVRSFC